MLVNEDDPVKAQLVDDRIQALITEANLLLSQRLSQTAATYLDLLIDGGEFSLPLVGDLDVLGLAKAGAILDSVARELPEGSPAAPALDEVIEFADLARENLDFALPLLGAVADPIKVDKVVVAGSTSELDSFAIAVAATVTLMFVTVLLVAGSLALEREENAFSRITRGLVGTTGLLAEKIALGIVASLAVTLLLLVGADATRLGRVGAGAVDPRSRCSPAAPASPRSAARSAAPPARCGRARCSRSWSRCRSPSSRWFPSGTVGARRLPRDRGRPRAVPVRSRARRRQRRPRFRRARRARAAAPPRGDRGRVRRSRPVALRRFA